MLLAPHHVAPECVIHDQHTPDAPLRRARWTWIAGRKYRAIRRY